MITEDYVSFETAKLLKEKGFDVECDYLYVNGNIIRAQGCKCNWNKGETIFTDYKNECSAPTLQMAMKWLRTEHNINVEVLLLEIEDGDYGYVIQGITTRCYLATSRRDSYQSPEQAAEAAIKYCLENLI